MTLALTFDWSPEFVAVTIVDAAARSIVAEGKSPRSSLSAEEGSSIDGWTSLAEATRTALDGLAVLNLTKEDIKSIELSGSVPDPTSVGAGSSAILSALLEPAHTAIDEDSSEIGVLSTSAASALGLRPGCPVTLSPSFERSLRRGDQVL